MHFPVIVHGFSLILQASFYMSLLLILQCPDFFFLATAYVQEEFKCTHSATVRYLPHQVRLQAPEPLSGVCILRDMSC